MPTIKTEDDVKIHYLPGLLAAAGYDLANVSYNVAIEVKQGRKRRTIFADAVVWQEPQHLHPLVVVETKPPTPLLEGDADQAISYARLLTPIAPLVLLTNGSTVGTKAYNTFTKEVFTAGLPKIADAVALTKAPVAPSVLALEATREVFKVDNVQEYKRILRASHNAIRNNEGYDPTKAFDELSKVMFTKLFEEQSKLGRFSVKKYDEFLASNVNIIQQIFAETNKDKEYEGLFIDGDKIDLTDRTIRELVGQFEGYDLSLTDFDVKGEAFEHFLGDTFTGGLGQYFTPRNVVNFMVDALDPKVGQTVVDPFCGTGGFLIKWHSVVEEKIAKMGISVEMKKQYLKTLNTVSLFGIDWNERTSLACRMNMTVHGEGQSAKNIFKQSGFSDALKGGDIVIGQEMFDVCLTNPPFGSAESDPVILAAHDLGAGRKSMERAALAMERALAVTKPGGWVSLIVMDGILSNSSMKFVRDHIRKHSHVRALISLTPETFEAYGGRSNTTVLILEKKLTPSDADAVTPTFMAMCRNTGYAPNGMEISGNELPDILAAYRNWQDGVKPTAPNIWEATVIDRLDPSHYWRPEGTAVVEGALNEEIKSTSSELLDIARALDETLVNLEAIPADVHHTTYKLGTLFEESVESVAVDPKVNYTLLGVRWWGGGAFAKEGKLGKDIKSPRLRKTVLGALVYNRMFAFRASFGIVGPECDGAFASSEFPMYEVRGGTSYDPVALKKYVVHALNSPTYLSLVDAESTGSTKTSRNRFKQEAFEAFEVAIPTDSDDLVRVVKLLDDADSLRERLVGLSTAGKNLRDQFSAMIPGA